MVEAKYASQLTQWRFAFSKRRQTHNVLCFNKLSRQLVDFFLSTK